MDRIYAPWRSAYTSKTARSKKANATKTECTFCKIISEKKDSKNFILKRFKHNMIMLNRYPYNAGHLLVMPLSHTADLAKLSKSARAELMEILSQGSVLLKKSLQAEGINIGLNQGKAASASIPSHLHFHVLPRWLGDTNFLPTLADTKQISFDLEKIYKQLKKAYTNTKTL